MKMLNSHNLIALIAFVILSLSACKKCGKKIGDLTEKSVQLAQFHSLNIDGKFTVKIIQDSSFSLKIKGGEGVVENVIYEILSDTLRLFNENKCEFLTNYNQEIILEIGVGELQKIALRNPGKIEDCDGLSSKDLLLEIRNCGVKFNLNGTFEKLKIFVAIGTPTLSLSGTANELEIDESSFGHIYAFDFETSKATISSSGTGIININVLNELHAHHNGSGIIRYKGNPSIVEVSIAENSHAEIIKD